MGARLTLWSISTAAFGRLLPVKNGRNRPEADVQRRLLSPVNVVGGLEAISQKQSIN